MRNVMCPMQIGIGMSKDKTKGFFKGKMDHVSSMLPVVIVI